MECQMCEGSCELLGQLGSLYHYCCRNCGMQFSTSTPPPVDDETLLPYTKTDASNTAFALEAFHKLPEPCRYPDGDGRLCGRSAVRGTQRCLHHTEYKGTP